MQTSLLKDDDILSIIDIDNIKKATLAPTKERATNSQDVKKSEGRQRRALGMRVTDAAFNTHSIGDHDWRKSFPH